MLEVGANPRQVAISQSADTRSFVPRDYLCVWHRDEEIACGVVIEVLPKGAVLRLDYAKERIRQGDRVYFAGSRYPAFASRAEEAVIEEEAVSRPWKRKYPFDLSVGYLVTQPFTFPQLHFQGMVATHWAVGIAGQSIAQNNAFLSAKGYGALLTVNYYGSRYYRGFWLQTSAGLLFLKNFANTGSTTTAPFALGTLGVRFGLWRGINIGLGVGGQYLPNPNSSLTFSARPFQFLGTGDIGFNF